MVKKIIILPTWANLIFYINKILLITFFIILCYVNESLPQMHGTVIICVIKNDTIWVGADSKTANENLTTVDSCCKILRFNDFIVSHAGFSSNEDFYVDSLITQVTSRVKGFYAVMDSIDTEMKISLQRFAIGKRNDIDTTMVLFAKFINSKPKIFFHIFITTSIAFDSIYFTAGTSLKIDSSIVYDNKFFRYFGETNVVFQTGIESVKNIPSFMGKLIINESKKNPFVGTPVSVIRLTKDSIEWEDNYKGLCEP